MTKTSNYEITDYGIENADYFQGHGTSFTRYAHSALGCGDSYDEALEDALDSAAQEGFEIDLLPEDDPALCPALKALSAWGYHCQNCDKEEHDACESNLYYYVGLRWN